MKKLLGAVLVWLVLPLSFSARGHQKTPVPEVKGLETLPVYIAQNTQNTEKKDVTASKEEEPSSKLPPPPPPRTIIIPEKPIKGAPDGIVRKKQPVETPPSKKAAADTTRSKISTQPAPEEAGKAAETRAPAPRKPVTVTKKPEIVKEELSIFNVPVANLRTMKTITDDDFNLRGLVYGEEKGFIRQLESDNDGNFKEVWKSPPLNAPVRGLFVDDIDKDGESEIVAYTTQGNIFIYGYKTHDLKYRTPEQTYPGISCMVVVNLDDDPQLELLFIAASPGSPGKLIQFDPKTQFEEWTSSRDYTATDMILGNVDNDPEIEIILNSGMILSSRFKNIKWESDTPFGNRLYLIDVDSDGILELVTEYDQSYIRVFDIDERREKW